MDLSFFLSSSSAVVRGRCEGDNGNYASGVVMQWSRVFKYFPYIYMVHEEIDGVQEAV